MSHGLRTYWRGDCRCLICRAAYRDYANSRYLARAKGQSNMVPINRAKQLLLTFESRIDAARVTKVSRRTVSEIWNGKRTMIRKSTEEKIVRVAA